MAKRETIQELIQAREDDIARRIQSDPELVSFINNATDEDLSLFKRQVYADYAEDKRFRVPTEPRPAGVRRKVAEHLMKVPDMSGTAMGLPSALAGSLGRLIMPEEDNTRPLFDEETESLITLLSEGGLQPADMDDSTLAQVTKAAKELSDMGAVPEKTYESFRLSAEQRLRERQEGTPATTFAREAGRGAVGTLVESADIITGGRGARLVGGPIGAIATGRQAAEGVLSRFGINLPKSGQVVDAAFGEISELKNAARGDSIEDAWALGAVAALVAGGMGAGIASRGQGIVGQLITQAGPDALLAYSAEPYLPGVIAELTGVTQGTPLAKMLTGVEGAAFAVAGNLLTGGARELRGISISRSARDAMNNMAETLKRLDAEGKLTKEAAAQAVSEATGQPPPFVREQIEQRLQVQRATQELTPAQKAERLAELEEVFTESPLEGVAIPPQARDARMQELARTMKGVDESAVMARQGTQVAQEAVARRAPTIPRPEKLTARQEEILDQIDALPEADFSLAEKGELTQALLRSEDEFRRLFEGLSFGKTVADDITPAIKVEDEVVTPPETRLTNRQKIEQLRARRAQQEVEAPVQPTPLRDIPIAEESRLANVSRQVKAEEDAGIDLTITGRGALENIRLTDDLVSEANRIEAGILPRETPPPAAVEPRTAPIHESVSAPVRETATVPTGKRIRDDSPEAAPILEEINAIMGVAKSRRSAMAEGQTKYLTSELDMLSDIEKSRLNELQLMLRPKSQAEAAADVRVKRAERLASKPAESPRVTETAPALKSYEVRNINGDVQTVTAKSPEDAARLVAGTGPRSKVIYENTTVIDLETGTPFMKGVSGDKFVEDVTSFRDTLAVPTESQLRQIESPDVTGWADRKIRESMGRLNMGIDPTLATAYAVKGAQLVGRGFVKAKDWTAQMIREYTPEVFPFLDKIWNRTKRIIQNLRFGVAWNRTYLVDMMDDTQAIKLFNPETGQFDKVVKSEFMAELQRRPSVVNNRVEQVRTERIPVIMRDMAALAEESGMTLAEFRKELKKYGVARHTPAYNREYGDGASSMTNEEASRFINNLTPEQTSRFNKALAYVRQLNDEATQMMTGSGLLSEKSRKFLKELYPEYVSLRRIMPEDYDKRGFDSIADQYFGGQQFRGSGVSRSRGGSKELEVDDVFDSALARWEDATRRSQANIQNREIKEFFTANKDTLGDLFKMYPAKVKSTIKTKAGVELPVFDDVPENALPIYENGKLFFMEFEDELLAKAVSGWNWRAKDGVARFMFNMLRKPVQMRSFYLTAGDVEFQLGNSQRDTWEALVNLKRNVPNANEARYIKRVPVAMRDMVIYQTVNGYPGGAAALGKSLNLTPTEMNRIARDVGDIFAEGGTVGGLATGTMRGVSGMEVQKFTKMLEGMSDGTRPITKKSIDEVLKGLGVWNAVFENANRIATYREAIATGQSKRTAAAAALNASFDPRRLGAYSGMAQAWFMFFNPAVQGGINYMKSMNPATKTGRRQMAKVLGVLGGTMGLAYEHNEAMLPGWRDVMKQGDPYGYDFTIPIIYGTKTDPKTGLTMPKYFPIFVSYPMQPLKRVMDMFWSGAYGYDNGDTGEMALNVLKGVEDGLSPVDTSRGWLAFTPGGYTPFIELAVNENWLGNPIYREEQSPLALNISQYFDSFAERPIGQGLISLTNWLYDTTGGLDGWADLNPQKLDYILKQYFSGAYKITESGFNVMNKAIRGEALEPNDVILLRRLMREVDAEIYLRREQIEKDSKKEAQKIARERTDINRSVRLLAREALKISEDKSPQEAEAFVQTKIEDGFFMDENGQPDTAMWDQFTDYIATREITLSERDRAIMALGKANGDRARQYFFMLREMKDDAERQRFVDDQVAKKLLDERVWRQIELLSRQPLPEKNTEK